MSSRSLVFEGDTWLRYERLRRENSAAHKSLVKILKDMLRDDPATGLGRPERLRHQLTGLWSRRFTLRDRVVYSFDEESVHILALGGHYRELR